MRMLSLVAVLLCICGVLNAAPMRGIVIPPPQSIVPATLEAELATMQPLISSGGSWSQLAVTCGLAYTIPQPDGLEVLCPDRAVVFVAKDEPALNGKLRVGGTLDWELVPNLCAYVGGVSGLGMSAGIKANLLSIGF